MGLILVGCDLAEQRAVLPESIAAAASHLARAERLLCPGPMPVAVWEPSPREMEDLGFRATLGDFDGLRDSFADLPGLRPLSWYAYSRQGRGTAMELLEELVRRRRDAAREVDPFAAREYQAVLEQYRDAVQREIVQPLLAAAQAAPQAELQTLRTLLAQVARLHHLALPNLDALLAERLESPHAQSEGLLPPAAWKQTSQLLDYAIRLARAAAPLANRGLGAGRPGKDFGGFLPGGNGLKQLPALRWPR